MEKRLPYYEIKGDHGEVGEFLGATFRKEIQEELGRRKKEIINYPQYLAKALDYCELTRKYFPELIEETEGIARGADVPMIEYFLVNTREVYDKWEGDHCTVVAGFDGDRLIIGHNEDWEAASQEEIYILKATIGETTFIGLNYISAVSGVAAGMNNHGLVQCINELNQTAGFGVPKNYVARAVLETKTLDEAETIIRSVPGASGFNHVLGQGSEIRDIETAGGRVGIQKTIGRPYVHTNHFISDELKALETEHSPSSIQRYARVSELLREKMTIENIRGILSDSQNEHQPICRPDETIGAALFVPSKLEAHFCYGHPCAGEFVKYSLR